MNIPASTLLGGVQASRSALNPYQKLISVYKRSSFCRGGGGGDGFGDAYQLWDHATPSQLDLHVSRRSSSSKESMCKQLRGKHALKIFYFGSVLHFILSLSTHQNQKQSDLLNLA